MAQNTKPQLLFEQDLVWNGFAICLVQSRIYSIFRRRKMSRDKLGLFAFGLVLLGFVVFVKTGSFFLFSVGILSVAVLVFSKSKFIK
jgi:hypothetical protein